MVFLFGNILVPLLFSMYESLPLLTYILQYFKVASDPSQLVWVWGPSTANMWKHWFDISDSWDSTVDNLQNMIRTEMYQSCGAYNTPGIQLRCLPIAVLLVRTSMGVLGWA